MPDNEHAASKDDELYEQAKALVLKHNDASVALVQCHLHLGYGTACNLFERMQGQRIVVPIPGASRQWALTRQE